MPSDAGPLRQCKATARSATGTTAGETSLAESHAALIYKFTLVDEEGNIFEYDGSHIVGKERWHKVKAAALAEPEIGCIYVSARSARLKPNQPQAYAAACDLVLGCRGGAARPRPRARRVLTFKNPCAGWCCEKFSVKVGLRSS